MRLRPNIEPEDQEVLTDHGGSRKWRASTQDVSPVVLVPPPKKQKSSAEDSTPPKTTWKCLASTRDASPDIQAPARKKQIQIQMSMSKEDARRREIFFNAMATIDRHQEPERLKAESNTTIHGYVPCGRQRASNTKRSNGKAVRFENGELTPNEQLEGDTERRMSELDRNYLKKISDEIDRELAELSEGENDEQTTCEYGHRESRAIKKRETRRYYRLSERRCQKHNQFLQNFRAPVCPPSRSSRNQERLWRPQSLSLEMGRQTLPQGP